MWAVTGWVVTTWAKLTALAALVLGISWWQLEPGWVVLSCVAAALFELWLVGALAAEWVAEARSSWWWTA